MTHRHALLVAHGSPADPDSQEARMQALAGAVAAHLPDWTLRGATLAKDGALEAALHGLTAPLIYPFFMAEGYFTKTVLPKRLAAAGASNARQLPPFGTDPALAALVTALLDTTATAHGLPKDQTTILLAAHGSKVSRTTTDTTRALAETLSREAGFARITMGFVEEPPFLADAARTSGPTSGPAICLPFFALRAGHVLDDVPQALAEAGFTGPLLPPLGEAADVPALIARALATRTS